MRNELVIVVNLGKPISNEINERIITKLFYQKITVLETVADLRQYFKEEELKAFIKARRRYDRETYWYLGISLLVLAIAIVYWGGGLDLARLSFSLGLAMILIMTMVSFSRDAVREIVVEMKASQENWRKYDQLIEILERESFPKGKRYEIKPNSNGLSEN